ncbi:MAG: protoporphyrinogen oxidase, partial [Verrucomicrobiota bacterium]|nr:protoporphyrinogen oxidase [Verrucomicrobiota bacterium]
MNKRIAVIGGGITGLTAAWRLHTLGHRVRLFEASGRVGGAIRSERRDGWLIEAGPNTLQVNSRQVDGILREIGLESQQLVANPAAKKRFLVRDERLQALPSSPPALLTSRLFSLSAKFRLISEIFAKRREHAGDVSLADFVRDHFGAELVDYGLEPFVAGIYAGDAEKLSTRHAFPKFLEIERTHGSLLRGQIASARERRARGEPRSRLISFAEGLQKLPDTLAATLPSGAIQLDATVDA